jgi:hypothetical protein
MDLSILPKDKIWFLRVCHHISNAVYLLVLWLYMWQSHNDTLCCTPSTGKGSVMAVNEELGYSYLLHTTNADIHVKGQGGAGLCCKLSLTLVHHFEPKSKRKMVEWCHTTSPRKMNFKCQWKDVDSLLGCNKFYSFKCHCLGWQLNFDNCNETQCLSVPREKCVKCYSTKTVPCHTSAYTSRGPLQNCCCTQPAVLTSHQSYCIFLWKMACEGRIMWMMRHWKMLFQQLQRNKSNFTGWEHWFLFKGGKRLLTNIRRIWKNNYAFRNFVNILMCTMQQHDIKVAGGITFWIILICCKIHITYRFLWRIVKTVKYTNVENYSSHICL